MPLQRSPCDDFTITLTPLDPNTPFCPTKKPRASLAAGSHWPAEGHCGEGVEGMDGE